MISSIALCFILSGSHFSDPPRSSSDLIPLFDPVETELLDRDHLYWARRNLAQWQELIEWRQRTLKESSGLFTPAEADRLRRPLEAWRESAIFMKRYVRELEIWEGERELNPGGETNQAAFRRAKALFKEWNAAEDARRPGFLAPSPREVKK